MLCHASFLQTGGLIVNLLRHLVADVSVFLTEAEAEEVASAPDLASSKEGFRGPGITYTLRRRTAPS